MSSNEDVRAVKFVVLGTPSGVGLDRIGEVFPRHSAFMEELVATGELECAGPFDNLGNIAIFTTRSAAERFATKDPFVLEGVISSYAVREWRYWAPARD